MKEINNNCVYHSPRIHKFSGNSSPFTHEGFHPITPDNKSKITQASSPLIKSIPPFSASAEYQHKINMQPLFIPPSEYTQKMNRSSQNLKKRVMENEQHKNFKMLSSDKVVDEAKFTFDKMKVKILRESENIVENNDDQMLKFYKSASQRNLILKKPQVENQILVIKSEKKISQEDDAQEINILKQQIKQAQRLNQKIKSQNLQLRLQKVKISSDSNTMQMLSLKREIKDLKQKIEGLNEEKKQYFEQYGLTSEGQNESSDSQIHVNEYFLEKNPRNNGWESLRTKIISSPADSQNINHKVKHSNTTTYQKLHLNSYQKLASSNNLISFYPGTPKITSTPTLNFNSYKKNSPISQKLTFFKTQQNPLSSRNQYSSYNQKYPQKKLSKI